MKILYKNSTTYSKKSLSEAYKTPTQPVRIIMIICGILFILWLIWATYPESPEESIHIGSAIFFLALIVYTFGFWLYFHKILANKDIRRYNALYHSDQIEHDIEFNEDNIKIHNLADGWVITLYYNQLIKIKETVHYFIVYIWTKKLFIIIDKLWFNKWDPKTFKEFVISKIKSNKELKNFEKSKNTK